MVYSHWVVSGQGQAPGTNGLYYTAKKLSHYTLTDTGAEFNCAPLASSGGGRRPATVPINMKAAILAFTLSIANINKTTDYSQVKFSFRQWATYRLGFQRRIFYPFFATCDDPQIHL